MIGDEREVKCGLHYSLFYSPPTANTGYEVQGEQVVPNTTSEVQPEVGQKVHAIARQLETNTWESASLSHLATLGPHHFRNLQLHLNRLKRVANMMWTTMQLDQIEGCAKPTPYVVETKEALQEQTRPFQSTITTTDDQNYYHLFYAQIGPTTIHSMRNDWGGFNFAVEGEGTPFLISTLAGATILHSTDGRGHAKLEPKTTYVLAYGQQSRLTFSLVRQDG